ncbi:MAG: 50S ribosomal protein L1 [bacterium]|nr:50S ribosomal protein L1 [bacterium]
MAKRSKRYQEAVKLVDSTNEYSLKEAIHILKKFPKPKFDETVEIAFRLGVDPRHSDQAVRSTVVLPHGVGKKVRVLAFAKGELAQQAKDAGADFVGFEDMIDKIQKGWLDFDAAVATPDSMRDIAKLGRVLGPRGLMPTPKTGTVTNDIVSAVKDLKAGKIDFKVDKAANVHTVVGKMSFSENNLFENAVSVYDAIIKAKPATAKGVYMKGCSLTSTMNPGLKIDLKSFIG